MDNKKEHVFYLLDFYTKKGFIKESFFDNETKLLHLVSHKNEYFNVDLELDTIDYIASIFLKTI